MLSGCWRELANQQLSVKGLLAIAHMTPHTLRRTFASILATCDVPPRRAMYLMGHTDPTLTLAVYQQVLDMGKSSVEILEQALGSTLTEARAIYNGEVPVGRVSGTNPEPSAK
jgi:integrase